MGTRPNITPTLAAGSASDTNVEKSLRDLLEMIADELVIRYVANNPLPTTGEVLEHERTDD